MNKFRTYAFWIALSGAVVILVQSLGKLFGFELDSGVIENVIMSICGVLVVLGIVTKTPEGETTKETTHEIKFIEETQKQTAEDKAQTEEIIEETNHEEVVIEISNEEVFNQEVIVEEIVISEDADYKNE